MAAGGAGVSGNDATVRIGFPDPGAAQAAAAALAPDNDGYLETRVEGREMVLTVQAESLMGLLRTLDDALGCIRALGVE